MVKAIFVTWEPKAALDGTIQLDAMEELAYRRILDLIYVSGNKLVDNDKKLAWMTKTGRRWKSIRAVLLGGDEPKLYVKDGFIMNKKCDLKLKEIEQKIEQASRAGKVSAKNRKSLNKKKTPPTGVGGTVGASLGKTTPKQPTESQPTHLTTEPMNTGTNVPDASASLGDCKDRIWGGCLKWLSEHTGKAEANLRPLVGKWCRDYGEEGVCVALEDALRDNPADPISWITAKLAAMSRVKGGNTTPREHTGFAAQVAKGMKGGRNG